jgi:putative NADH-flavin reductase
VKILVLGAGGAVGSRLVQEALRRGHEVTEGTHDVVDATNAASIAAAAAGHDVVLSAVIDRSAPELLVDVARALLDGLGRTGVPRLLVVGGAGTLELEPGRLVMDGDDFNVDYRAEAKALLDVLRILQAADTPVDWSYITPPRGLEPGERTGSYRVGGGQALFDAEGESRISMEDFAVAMLDEAEHPRHVRRRFSVAY